MSDNERQTEWEGICFLIEQWWPGEFPDPSREALKIALDGWDASEIANALRGLLAKGLTFRPSAAEVVGMLRHDASVPTFDEAYRMIYGAGGVLRGRPIESSWPDTASRERAYERAWEARARRLHPMVGSFVLRYGVERLHRLEVDHEDYGPHRRRELRASWEQHLEAMEGRDVAAIAAGGRRGQLGKLDPLAALGPLGRRAKQIGPSS